MDSKLFDTVTIILAIVLLPMVAASAWAFYQGNLSIAEYADLWGEPIALLLGFFLKDRRQ